VKAKEKAIKVFDKIFKRQEMPKFAIYSRLDKNLLKMMLIRATELEDAELPEHRIKYFNPEKEEEEIEQENIEVNDQQPEEKLEELLSPAVDSTSEERS